MLAQTSKSSGFTLMEILIVVVIIGILMGVAAVNLSGSPDEARISASKQELRNLQLALDLYRMQNAHFPSNDQGLKALIEKPNGSPEPKSWQKGGYMKGKDVPKDPWDNPYKYLNPGTHGEVDIYSLGPDGRESDDDIGNWQLD